jgi:hypothetical protein
MQPAFCADAENRHDIGVVHRRRRPRFPLETLLLLRVGEHLIWQHLERHASPQGDLLGLVDDAHATAADLADDPVVTQLLQGRSSRAAILGRVAPLAQPGPMALHQQERREKRMDPLGPPGIALGVLDGLRALSATVARLELLR